MQEYELILFVKTVSKRLGQTMASDIVAAAKNFETEIHETINSYSGKYELAVCSKELDEDGDPDEYLEL